MPIIQPRLSPTQARVLDFYFEFWLEHGAPPLYIDIAEHFGFSEQTAERHIQKIVGKDYLLLRPTLRGGRGHRTFVPPRPLIFVRPADEGVIIATIGGPMRYTLPEWREFLVGHLDTLDDAEEADRRRRPVELRLVRAEPDDDQAGAETRSA